MRRSAILSLLMLAHAVPTVAFAADEAPPIATAAPELDEVYVWGKREGRIGQATSASEGTVSFSAYAIRPILRPGELAEVIPGLASTQHLSLIHI